MKFRHAFTIWLLSILVLIMFYVAIQLSKPLYTTTDITTIVDSIIDVRCITDFDKDLMAIMERVNRKTIAHDPELYAEEQRYFDVWQKRRFAKHNDSTEWLMKDKEE